MKFRNHAFTAGVVILTSALAFGFAALAHPNTAQHVTGDDRVDQLLAKMSLEEKLTLVHGTQENSASYQGQAGYMAGIPRLGVPGLRFADGPPGLLVRHASEAETATMGVAATFSRQDAEANGVVIGREARDFGIDVALQPFVNIDRDLEFSRSYNTFGEDPLLTSEMGAAEIRGIQSQDVMAQVKHFIAYDSENGSTIVDPQTLHEVYLAPFDAAVQAGVSSIMCSYNRINGTFACGNESTLSHMLRDEIGFRGFVTSDWGATHAVNFMNAGLDMEMPGPAAPSSLFQMSSYFDSQSAPARPAALLPADFDVDSMLGGHIPEEPPPSPRSLSDFNVSLDPKKMPAALKDGTISEVRITQAAGRVLYEMEKFGYLDGRSKHEITPEHIAANAKIIQKTSEDAAVLLKNEGGILPLKVSDLRDVVFIGPGAGQVMAIGINGERSVGLPERQVSPLDAIRKISGNPSIRFAVNDDMTGTTIPESILSHEGQPGLDRIDTKSGKTIGIDRQINFTKKGGNALQAGMAAMWKGTLTVPRTGDYWLYLQALGTNASVSIDGKRRLATGVFQGGFHGDILQAAQDNTVPTTDGLDNVRRSVQLTAGSHTIEMQTTSDSSNAPVQLRLNWYTPEQREADHEAAIAAARSAKLAVVFLWTRLQPVFGLPDEQNKLVDEVTAVNPNTIVVLNTSQPVALPWIEKVKAILEMWWPGDEGGWSTANVLLGRVSPTGRLPVTWGKRLEDYCATDPNHPERSSRGVEGKTTYSEGVDVGYRWFDRQKTDPLFPFGFGLSYTSFEYSDLVVVKRSDGGLDVTVTIRNTGNVDSDDVPQVYITAPDRVPDGVQFPVRSLIAFDRIHLNAGTSRKITIPVALRQLEYWSTATNRWVSPTGVRRLYVGASSRDLRLNSTLAF